MGMNDRRYFEKLDSQDPLARFRGEFELPEELVYLDGNSLGALPKRTRERLRHVTEEEWGRGLIGSWTEAGWMSMPPRTGDKIARLIGAAAGEVVVTDSTSVNLFKALSLALQVDPARRLVLSERGNFPTDLYIANGLIKQLGRGHELLQVESAADAIEQALGDRGAEVAVVMLTHVNFTTARVHDMSRITSAAHAAGAVVIWDLSHSTGAVPVDLAACDADFAVGCGYKYLNGGPGAPAFLYVSRRFHHLSQPISGWMGDARPFEFRPDYRPAPGISRYMSGTPPVLAMSALESGVDLILEADMAAMRTKSIALTDAFIALVDDRCAGLGFELVTPRDAAVRGSHVSYRHRANASIMRTLATRGVIGDCRPPDLLRFGFAPLYVRHVDAWDAVEHLAAAVRIAA